MRRGIKSYKIGTGAIMEARFKAIGLNEKVVENTLKNKSLTTRLASVLDMAQVSSEAGCVKEKGRNDVILGNLYYAIASKAPVTMEKELGVMAEFVAADKIKTTK